MFSKIYFYSFYFQKKEIYWHENEIIKNNLNFHVLAETNDLEIIKFLNNKGYYNNDDFLVKNENIFFGNIYINCLLENFFKNNLYFKKNKTENLKYLFYNFKGNKRIIYNKYLLFIDMIINNHSVDFAIELFENKEFKIITYNSICEDNSTAIQRAKLTENKKILEYFNSRNILKK